MSSARPAFGQPAPPPYRAPPPSRAYPPPQPPSLPHQQQQQQQPGTPAYSKFNVSEPNVAATSYERHTINHDHSQRMQHGLRNLLGGQTPSSAPKHNTLDSHGQSAALHHLRSNGLQPQMEGMQTNGNSSAGGNDPFASPDALRDTANRLFTRNNNDRSSFGGVATNGYSPQVPHHPGQRPNMMQQQQQVHQQHGPARFSTPVMSGGRGQQPLPQQQQQQQHMVTSVPLDSGTKRLSYTNQSFRKALAQEQQMQQQQQGKTPPQVPPKPFSRSTSRERLKEDANNDANVAALDDELRNILSGNRGAGFGNGSSTPPLPALSPVDASMSHQHHQHHQQLLHHHHQQQQQQNFGKHSSNDLNGTLNHRPDLLGDAELQDKKKSGPASGLSASGKGLLPPGAALDLERVLAVTGEATSTDDEEDEDASTTIDVGDAASIRKQLDGLENMYSEVLKLLGLRKFGRPHQPNGGLDPRSGLHGRRSKMYGSMSSLPSVSSIGSRHLYKGDRRHHTKTDKNGTRSGDRSGTRDGRSQNKRFQRLESHVVTLARSVAHLSSEMRSQHLIVQEIEALRGEVEQLRLVQQQSRQALEPEQFFHLANGGANFPATGIVSQLQANRVKKLTKFFGDEPPLLRLFLKNLGYEKYAAIFEEAKIGLLELPYIAEDRLEKLGIPLGPRIRILQESRVAAAATQGPLVAPHQHQHQQQQQQQQGDAPNYNVYIL